jgi:cobalt-zinc-cadmium efflux system outer membrane protein
MFLSILLKGVIRTSRIVAAGSCLTLVLPSNPGVAAQETISLAKALQLSLANNRDLQLYPYQRSSAEALLLQAGLRPILSAELSVENALGGGDYNSFEASETTLTLSKVIELGEKREQRIDVAQAQQDQLSTEYELSRLDVLAESSRRYYHILTLQALAKINAQRLTEDRRAFEAISTRNRAGAAAAADVSKLELRVARSRATAQKLLNEKVLAVQRLAAMWQAEADFEGVEGDLSVIPVLPTLPALHSAIDRAPRLQQQFSLQRLADARVELAQANGRSDLTLGLGVRHFEASNDQAMVFSVAMPLAFSNPNEGRIRAARADLQRSTRNTQLLAQTLKLELLQVYQHLQNNRDRALQVRDELLPLALKLIEATRRGYQLGQYSVLQWTDAQAERFALERELVNLYGAIYLQLLELERITGEPLAGVTKGDLS